ncbi:MAG: FHA domain-containing protein, partial [Persicimonas sp.]
LRERFARGEIDEEEFEAREATSLAEPTEPDPDGGAIVDEAVIDEELPDGDFEENDKTTVSLTGSPAMAADGAHADPAQADTPVTSESQPADPDERPSGRHGDVLPPKHPTFDPYGASDVDMLEEAPIEEKEEADEDDFYSEKTEVFDSPYENDLVVPKLSVLSGPDAGQEFLINQNRNTIGRGKHNSIVVSDLAMSRQHLEIVKRGPSSYTVVDLQSANGTRLNDTPVREAELCHGDRLEAGKTEFQFIIPGNQPQDRSPDRRLVPAAAETATDNPTVVSSMPSTGSSGSDDSTDRILTAVIIGAGLLSVALLGAALYLYFDDGQQAADAEATSSDSRAQQLYLEGVERVKDRDWEDAQALFEQVEEINGEFPGLDAQFERVEREADTKSTLERAQDALDEGQEDRAAELAMEISSESVYFEDAQNLVRQTRQHRVASYFERAQEAVTSEEFERADDLLDDILEEVPDHQGALELRETIAEERDEGDEKSEEVDNEDDEDDENDSTQDQARAPDPKPSTDNGDKTSSGSASRSSGAKPAGRINFTEGFSLYKDGKFDRAASYFRKAADEGAGRATDRAASVAENISRFSEVYTGANRTLEAGAWKRAIGELERAKKFDEQVAGTGYYGAAIDEKLALAHAEKGLAELKAGKFQSAARHHTEARTYDSSHSKVTSLRRELSNKARSLYIQAANKRKSDPEKSAEICESIKEMVPADHSMHQKADKLLEELE